MELQGKKVAMSNTIVNDNSKMFSMGTDRLLDIFTFRSEQESQTTEDSQQSRHNWTPLSSATARLIRKYLTVEESFAIWLIPEIMRPHPICVP
jgi:hypothetical protein